MFLNHTGVKGMKWGHRKTYDDYKKDRYTVLKKGNLIGHVTEGGNFKIKSDFIYTYHDKFDRSNYAGIMALTRVNNAHEVLMKTKVDLITPNRKRRVDSFLELMKDKTKDDILSEMGKNKVESSVFLAILRLFQRKKYNNPGEIGYEKKIANKNAKKYKNILETGRRQDLEKMYDDFNAYLMISKKNREKYFTKLKKEGFNSIIDDHDVVEYGSRSPVIIFDAKKSLKVLGVNKLTNKEINDAADEAMKDIKKVTKIVEEDKVMNHSDYEKALTHFGIRGMKWGHLKQKNTEYKNKISNLSKSTKVHNTDRKLFENASKPMRKKIGGHLGVGILSQLLSRVVTGKISELDSKAGMISFAKDVAKNTAFTFGVTEAMTRSAASKYNTDGKLKSGKKVNNYLPTREQVGVMALNTTRAMIPFVKGMAGMKVFEAYKKRADNQARVDKWGGRILEQSVSSVKFNSPKWTSQDGNTIVF